MVKKLKICIIGAESWGSAIATAVCFNAFNSAKIDNRVHLYVYDDLVDNNNLSDVINDTHENIKYLPGIHLPENLIAINDLLEAAKDADILIFSTPMHFVKSYCNILAGQIKSTVIAVSLVKGLERIKDGEIDLFTNGISKQLGIPCYSFVTANSAMEMAQGKLCEVTIGCDNEEHSQLLKEIFQTMNCKVVTLPDVEGVELCGALKGVIALGAGFVDGLHLGDNARVAVIHLGLKEIMRFVKSFYPNTKLSTFFESCGVADLVASCYDDNNLTFAKAFVTSGKTLQELESSLPPNKELLGPQIVDQVYNFLSKSNKEHQYPLFTAIHKICQNEQHPETIIESLRNHPDLHYPSITNLLNSELMSTRNLPTNPAYEVDDDTAYLESQNKDDLITAEYEPAKFVFNKDDIDYTDLQNKNNILKITAEHEPPESVYESDNTVYSESQSKDDSMKITSEYQPIKSDIDYTESQNKDILFNVNDDRQTADVVYKMNDTDYSESLNKKNLLEVTAEEKQGQSVGSDLSYPENIIIQFADVPPKFSGSRINNIVNSTSDPPKEPTQEDWMGDNEWRPQDFEVKEIEYPSGEQPNVKNDNPFQDDWMGDNEWRPHDVNVEKMENPVIDKFTSDNFALANQFEHPDIGETETSETNPKKETVKILLDFRFGDNNEENIADNKLVPNFVVLSAKEPEAHQKEPVKPIMYESLSDYKKQNHLKPTKQVELYDPEIDIYAMGPYTDAESFTPLPDTLESIEDFKTKPVEIASLNSDNENYNQTPTKGTFESDIDNPSEIQEPVMEINDDSFQNENTKQGTKFEIEDTIDDSFFDASQMYLEESSQYEPIDEVSKIEMNDSNSKGKGIEQAPPKGKNIEIIDNIFKNDCAYNAIFEELGFSSPQDKDNEHNLGQKKKSTEFDEIFEELAASKTHDKSNDEVIPQIEKKKTEFSLDFESIIKELGKTALENERNRQVPNMSMKNDLENERSRQVAKMSMQNDLKKERSRQVSKMSMNDDLENERSRQVPKLNMNDSSILAEHTKILKEEPKIKSDMEKSDEKIADSNLNLTHGINSAINSKDNNKIESGDNANNKQLSTWKNLFEETEKEEKSPINAFKSSKEEEDIDKMLTQAYDEQLKKQRSEWNWIQLSNEEENNNEIRTGNENVLTNKINTETGNENLITNKINSENKNKSGKKEDNAQKDQSTPITLSGKSNAETGNENVITNKISSENKNKSDKKEENVQKDKPTPITLSGKSSAETGNENVINAQKDKPPPITLNSNKSNAEVPETSFQLTTSKEEQHQQKQSNEPKPDAKSVNVNIVDLEKLKAATEKENSTSQNELDSSIDSVYAFVEKVERTEDSKASESWESLADTKNTEAPKPAPKNKTDEKIAAPVDKSKSKIHDNEAKPDSFMTTKLKHLMNNKTPKRHESPYRYNPNLNAYDISVRNVDDLKKTEQKNQEGKKYVLRTPFHPPLNPRVKIPKPPFDGREHEYHTLAYRMPRPILTKQNNLRRNYTRTEVIRKIPPVYGTKSLFNIMRANKILCAFQAGMFAAIFCRYGKL